MKRLLFIYFILMNLIEINQCRQTLRDYFIRQDPSISSLKDQWIISDHDDENDLICRLETFQYGFIRLINLYSYPTKFIIGSIQENLWSNNHLLSQMKIYDDEYQQWINGQIIDQSTLQRIRLRIEYNGNIYLMENHFKSELIQIRNEKRREILLTRFYPRFPLFSSTMKYHLQIYSNELPDQIYILAFSMFNSRKTKTIL